jgi:tRNA(fMet)-specific endonuclease VapC
MLAANDEIGCTIASAEEMLRGWLALIHRQRDVHRQIAAYARLGQIIDLFSEWHVVPFDKRAADQFVVLRRQRPRMGAMDLKIASIALANDAVLATGNRRDFAAVPGLQLVDWLRA